MAVGRERGGDSASLTRRESQLGNAGAEAYDRPARVGRSVGERGRVCQGGVRETDAIQASSGSFTLLR
jgi:hypothetical protein